VPWEFVYCANAAGDAINAAARIAGMVSFMEASIGFPKSTANEDHSFHEQKFRKLGSF
jgi:hypothetical protein